MTTESIPDQGSKRGRVSRPLAQRIRRGIEHYANHGEYIEWVAEDRCKVPSCKHPEHFYLVVFGEDGERCVCPDFSRNNIGVCKHTIAALISWAKKVDHRVEKRHDSRLGAYVWDVVETHAGVDRVVETYWYIGTAYHALWALPGTNAGEAA